MITKTEFFRALEDSGFLGEEMGFNWVGFEALVFVLPHISRASILSIGLISSFNI